ncbi:hypothetical protein FA95DRAFT_1580111 [Auriscalpium vulgare]|uniref:Uncharacterized protein n=1 Tax=Auriscalpium vulgare TaxID=40419 RepID=A0ACB8S7R5_9AGAM|nr:hypothetical protein FA95DRAFT_1580111 [Auriscalpium vulgare]
MFFDRELGEPATHGIVLFTRDWGPVPAFVTSLYCRNCRTRYYPDYFVHTSATIRTYYMAPCSVIEVSEHYHIERSVCAHITDTFAIAAVSATDFADIYNAGTPDDIKLLLPFNWCAVFALNVKLVWNAFFLHSLLQDHMERRRPMELRHDASSQGARLQPLLAERNRAMAGPGQDEWNHACDLCCWISEGENGIRKGLRATVTDGVTIGHPCCSVHDCPHPLLSVNHLFCELHKAHNLVCSVASCINPAVPDRFTCDLPEHSQLEDSHFAQGQSMGVLRRRYENVNGIAHDTADEVNCPEKPELGNRAPPKARFHRRWTHNEELCVYTCGVIAGRATFFGSESPNGVRRFWMRLFPTRNSLPGVMYYDSNCLLQAMLENDPDPYDRTYFDDSALGVDAFHFSTKHKATDVECGRRCNPYIWPELRTPDGQWRFNSSIAEQVNVWIKGYVNIVREMEVTRYNFFLDEMVKLRNQRTVAKLRARGHRPYRIPRDVLLAL